MNSSSSENVEWGPEIPVNGVRPEWLGDDDKFQYQTPRCFGCWHSWLDPQWNDVTAIRLKANHPHYAADRATNAPTAPVQGQSGVGTGQECLKRMEALYDRMTALCRRMVAEKPETSYLWWRDEARAIVALLPEPVDPDKLEAQKVLATCGWVDDDLNYDAAYDVALEALARGRALQMGEG